MARPSLSVPTIWPWWGGSKAGANDGDADRASGRDWQAGLRSADDVAAEAGQLWGWALARRGLRLRLLIVLRWVSIAGETAAVLWVGLFLRFHLPILACMSVIGVAAAAAR